MLKQASVGDIFSGKVTREDGHIVVVMRHYPRFLRREYRDEYVYALAPPRLLFEHFRLIKTETLDHAYAFKTVKYENEFWLEPEGLAALKRLAKRSEREDVFLVCQCTVGEHCHRELLMLMARELYGAKLGELHNPYKTFLRKLKRRTASAGAGLGAAPA